MSPFTPTHLSRGCQPVSVNHSTPNSGFLSKVNWWCVGSAQLDPFKPEPPWTCQFQLLFISSRLFFGYAAEIPFELSLTPCISVFSLKGGGCISHFLSLCTLASATKQPVAPIARTCQLSHSLIRAIWAANGEEPAEGMGIGVRDGFVMGDWEAECTNGHTGLFAVLLEAGSDWGRGFMAPGVHFVRQEMCSCKVEHAAATGAGSAFAAGAGWQTG